MTASTTAFRTQIQAIFRRAADHHARDVEINAGALHRMVGISAGQGISACCDAMLEEMQPGDEVFARPPKGKGALLTIRYKLPRDFRSPPDAAAASR